MLAPDASRLVQNWTPRDQATLDSGDLDLGSTAPALLTRGLAVQSGKDARMRLLRLARLNGTVKAGRRLGGEVQTLSTPSGDGLLTAPAVWSDRGRTWLFVADGGATEAFRLLGGRLRRAWKVARGGTSPIVAGGLLYVYDADGGRLNVYRPTSGRRVTSLTARPGHWNSPIVTDGRVALPVGDANDHRTSGTLVIYRLP
jgi:hypothetical protein